MHKASKTAANINRAWGEGSTRDWIVWCWFQKFYSGNTNLEDQEGRRCSSSINWKDLLNNPHCVKVSKKCLGQWVLALQENQQSKEIGSTWTQWKSWNSRFWCVFSDVSVELEWSISLWNNLWWKRDPL